MPLHSPNKSSPSLSFFQSHNLLNPNKMSDSQSTNSVLHHLVSERDNIRKLIVGRWGDLKKIDYETMKDGLFKEGLISWEECESFTKESERMCTARKNRTLLLFAVRNIDDSSDFNKFLRVLTEYCDNFWCAELCRKPSTPTLCLRNHSAFAQHVSRIKENRELLEKEILPKLHVDDFLQHCIFDLDQYEEIWLIADVRRKMAKKFVDAVIKSADRGSFIFLMDIFEKSKRQGYKLLLLVLQKQLDTPCTKSKLPSPCCELFRLSTEDRDKARNKIIGRWKTLKTQIHPDMLSERLYNTGLMSLEDLDTYNTKAINMASGQMIDFILTVVVRNIENDCDFTKFVNVLKEDNSFVVNEIQQEFFEPEWSTKSIDSEQCKQQITTVRSVLEKELMPKKHIDDFLENIIFDLDQYEDLLNSPQTRKEMSEMFVQAVLETISNGSYQYLIHTLNSSDARGYKRILEALQRTPVTGHVRSQTTVVNMEDRFYISCDTDEGKHGLKVPLIMTIKFPPEIGDNKRIVDSIKEEVFSQLMKDGFKITGYKDGSIIIFIEPLTSACTRNFKQSITKGHLVTALKQAFEKDEVKYRLLCGEFSIDITLTEHKLTVKEISSDFATSSYCLLESSKEYTNILIASRQFLVEEIEPLLLVESFPANFTAFVNINFRDIKDRRKRTETFLQIIEAEQSFDILVDVIEKRKMHYVSRMINLWERSRAIDINTLRQNLLRVVDIITEEMNLDSIADVFRDRNMIDEHKFCKLIDGCQNGNLECLEFLIDIFKGKTEHVLTLIDALLLNHLDTIVSGVLEPSNRDDERSNEDSMECDATLPDGVLFKGKINVIVKDGFGNCQSEDIICIKSTKREEHQLDGEAIKSDLDLIVSSDDTINCSENVSSSSDESLRKNETGANYLTNALDVGTQQSHDLQNVVGVPFEGDINEDQNYLDRTSTVVPCPQPLDNISISLDPNDPLTVVHDQSEKKQDTTDIQNPKHKTDTGSCMTATGTTRLDDDQVFHETTTDGRIEDEHEFPDIVMPSWKCKPLQGQRISLPSITINKLDGTKRIVAAKEVLVRTKSFNISDIDDCITYEEMDMCVEEGSHERTLNEDTKKILTTSEPRDKQPFSKSVLAPGFSANEELSDRKSRYDETEALSFPIKQKTAIKVPKITIKALDGTVRSLEDMLVDDSVKGMDEEEIIYLREVRKKEKGEAEVRGSSARKTPAQVFGFSKEAMTEVKWRRKYECETQIGSNLSLEELQMQCAPDTILLLDISGSIKGSAYTDLLNFVSDLLDKRAATREDTGIQENIGMATFGHRTEVIHHLTCDYGLVKQKLEQLPSPGGPSPLVGGLYMCKAVIEARGKISVTKTSERSLKLHPRIILVSDGNLTPLDCVIGDMNIDDLNSDMKDEQEKSIFKLFEICNEFKNDKIKIYCVPVGCFNQERLQMIADLTDGRLVKMEKGEAYRLGNEYMKMIYAKLINDDEHLANDLQRKLLSFRSMSPEDYDEIINIAKNNQIPYLDENDDDEDEREDYTEMFDFPTFMILDNENGDDYNDPFHAVSFDDDDEEEF